MTRVIEARGLVRRYAADGSPVRAVDCVDLEVEAGEAVSVMGPSGCGKSTLLHLLGGLERPDTGELHLGGERVDGLSETQWAVFRRRNVGFVFQAFHLVDELTSVENVELPALEGGDLPAVRVSATALVLLAAAVPIVFAGIVWIPARLLSRRPVAPLLVYE